MSTVHEPADTLSRLLKAVGTPAVCRKCREPIIVLIEKSGARVTYTPDGIMHWIACTPASRINRILRTVGSAGTCRTCGGAVIWIKTKNDKNAIFNRDGVSHWATCPDAQRHRIQRTGT